MLQNIIHFPQGIIRSCYQPNAIMPGRTMGTPKASEAQGQILQTSRYAGGMPLIYDYGDWSLCVCHRLMELGELHVLFRIVNEILTF